MVVSITPNWQMVQAYYAMLAYTTALLRFHNPQLGDTSGHNDLWCKYIAGLRNYSIRAVLPRPFCSIAQFSISPGGMFGWDWDNNPAEFGFLLEMMGDLLREVAQKSVDAQTGDLSFFHFFHYFSELYRYYTVLPTIFTRSRRLRDFRPSLTNLFNVLALSVEYTFLRVFPEVFVVFASEFLTSLRTDGITRSTPLQFRVELYCKQGLIPEEYSKGSQECEWARQIQKQMTIRMEHEFPTRPILAEAYQKRGAGWR